MMSSACTSLRFEGAREPARTTGQSVRSRIREKRRVVETREGSITAERRAQSSAKGPAFRATCVSTRTACLSAGFIHLDIERNCARTEGRATAAHASLRIIHRSLEYQRMPLAIH